jgi:hypothetical protein
MGQTVGKRLGDCNGLNATQPMPERVTAFTRAFKKLNAKALDDLHERLRQALANHDKLKADGKKLRDVHPREWLFSFGMLQVMKPGERTDWYHIDGAASFLHLGLGLFGNRTLKHWEKEREAAHEVTEGPGSVYISMPAVYDHQVEHRDSPVDPAALMDFGDMGPCKVAIQLRCDLFPLHRARTKTPKIASDMIAAVVQPWLSQTSRMLPGLDQCMCGMQKQSNAAMGASSSGAVGPESANTADDTTVQECSQIDADGVGDSKLAMSDECAKIEEESTASTRSSATASEAIAERERPSMGAGETVRALEAGDTVKVLTGPWAGEVRIVSEAKADSYEVDEQWFERSQLEFQF